jgi:hypothetical protein
LVLSRQMLWPEEARLEEQLDTPTCMWTPKSSGQRDGVLGLACFEVQGRCSGPLPVLGPGREAPDGGWG